MTDPRRKILAPGLRPAFAPLVIWVAVISLLTPPAEAAAAAAAAAAGDAKSASNARRVIRTHGNDDRYWLIQLEDLAREKGPKKQGQIYRRDRGEEFWHPVVTIQGDDVASIGGRLTQLAILDADGTWVLLSDETATTGPPLPNGARLLAFGTDGTALWAIGQPLAGGGPGSRPSVPGTAPATGPSATAPASVAAATGPTTGPASGPATTTVSVEGSTLALYSLQSHGWVRGVELPQAAQGPPHLISLAFVDREPVIAWRMSPTSAVAWRLKDGIWWPAGEVKSEATITRLKLIDGTPRPVLWTATVGQEAALTWLVPGDPKRVTVPVDPRGRAEDLAVAYANGRVRVVGFEGDKLIERAFDPLTGAPAGAATPLTLPKPLGPSTVSDWVVPLLVVLMMYVIVASVRRREQLRDIAENPGEFVLAPVGRRLMAGMIDVLPALVGCGVALRLYAGDNPGAKMHEPWDRVMDNMAPAQVALCFGGVLLYLLHTSLGEALFGRSIGKAICRLRVVGLDGRAASPSAVVTRNLLRIIDLAMFLFPLLLILFSPLRQRAGDVAAGTLVVLAGKSTPAEPGATAGPGDGSADVGGRSSRSDP